jgi:putative membrane protein
MMKTNKFLQIACAMTFATLTGQAIAADVSMSDARFLKKAANAGHYEVEGSKLALKKSNNAEIQKFAKQMVDDHTKAAEELKALALKKKVEVPVEPNFMQKGSLMLLGTHDGKNFDEEYAEHVGVDAHEATIELFEDAAKSAEDADIKQFANKTLPTLKHHFEMAKALDNAVDK